MMGNMTVMMRNMTVMMGNMVEESIEITDAGSCSHCLSLIKS